MITKVDNTMGHPVLIRTGLVSEKFGTALHYILQVFVQKNPP